MIITKIVTITTKKTIKFSIENRSHKKRKQSPYEGLKSKITKILNLEENQFGKSNTVQLTLTKFLIWNKLYTSKHYTIMTR